MSKSKKVMWVPVQFDWKQAPEDVIDELNGVLRQLRSPIRIRVFNLEDDQVYAAVGLRAMLPTVNQFKEEIGIDD